MEINGINVYITVAISLFTQSLHDATKILSKDIETFVEILDNWQLELQLSITNNESDKEENSEKADAHVRKINESANKAIEEADKIKIKDIT